MSDYYMQLNIEPVPKARPRYKRNGHAYTPEKTRTYEKLVARAWLEQCGRTELDGALEAKMEFYVKIPKSFSKTKREKALSGELRPAVRPDVDNYTKAVQDALNGVAYKDDGQIVDAHALKVYSDNPRVIVTIKG